MCPRKKREKPGVERAIDAAGSQTELAHMLTARMPGRKKISQQAISRWEDRGYVPDKHAPMVATITGIPVEDLVSVHARKLMLNK